MGNKNQKLNLPNNDSYLLDNGIMKNIGKINAININDIN